MPTKTKTNTEKGIRREHVEEARQDLARAQARLRELSEEAAQLPAQLKEALGEAARQRADLARKGESAAYAAADIDVETLRQRREQVRLELWATQVAVEECKVALYAAEDALAVEEHKEATDRFEAIKPEYEALRAEYEAARGAASRDPWSMHRSNLRKTAKEKLAELENSYPGGPLDA